MTSKVHSTGHPSLFEESQYRQFSKPIPEGKDLLVKVKAISVNPVDVKVRAPKDKTEDSPKILGWVVAGIVEQVGSECTHFHPGDEVYYAGSITRAGGNSEYHLVDERIVGKKPALLDSAQAAALPLTAITAWEALFDRLGVSRNPEVNKGKAILIIGAAGGVGSIAIQLAKYAGLTVIGTASQPKSTAWVKEMGADHTINHYDAFVPQLNKAGFQNVEYIFCLNSTEQHWQNMAEAIAPQGKICSIVETDQPLNLTLLKNKSITFVWELMLRTTITERLKPIHAANLRKAHAIIEEGRTIGKIVLEEF
ncbi:zinc-binding alcohol dehydrogenase family protein [Paenibacillus wynnii]|uniref:Zinc-type alcohol dehydrogenase-like protein n=1 Tax=Paenibacillus wynnii TaxID=268407 RepID=A0A098M5B3_9BACL|nr:zinc-binding alcohol dehydrogenase family protein [Paenibacillus wynnii]KGE17236.1 NADPH:quinone reductase [Paenibacillus wynnii]